MLCCCFAVAAVVVCVFSHQYATVMERFCLSRNLKIYLVLMHKCINHITLSAMPVCNSTLSNHEIIKTDDSHEEPKTANFEFQSLTPKERTVAVALWNVAVLQEQYCVLKESTAH